MERTRKAQGTLTVASSTWDRAVHQSLPENAVRLVKCNSNRIKELRVFFRTVSRRPFRVISLANVSAPLKRKGRAAAVLAVICSETTASRPSSMAQFADFGKQEQRSDSEHIRCCSPHNNDSGGCCPAEPAAASPAPPVYDRPPSWHNRCRSTCPHFSVSPMGCSSPVLADIADNCSALQPGQRHNPQKSALRAGSGERINSQ